MIKSSAWLQEFKVHHQNSSNKKTYLPQVDPSNSDNKHENG